MGQPERTFPDPPWNGTDLTPKFCGTLGHFSSVSAHVRCKSQLASDGIHFRSILFFSCLLLCVHFCGSLCHISSGKAQETAGLRRNCFLFILLVFLVYFTSELLWNIVPHACGTLSHSVPCCATCATCATTWHMWNNKGVGTLCHKRDSRTYSLHLGGRKTHT